MVAVASIHHHLRATGVNVEECKFLIIPEDQRETPGETRVPGG